jgi:hypothetical protein
MKKGQDSRNRVLARQLAKELGSDELQKTHGQGTSYSGTGSCDAQGRGEDIQAVDCCIGNDTFKC